MWLLQATVSVSIQLFEHFFRDPPLNFAFKKKNYKKKYALYDNWGPVELPLRTVIMQPSFICVY